MIYLAVPIFFTRVSWVIMKVTDTALLGHAGTHYLEAVSLSDLWTQSTGVFIMSMATSTLCAQALGAGNKHLVGIWIQVALAVLTPICVVVAIFWALTGTVLRAAGKDVDLADDANYYAVVLMICLPVRIIFAQCSTFLTSQKIMRPGVICSTIGMVLNLVFGLPLVLGIPIPGWDGIGFKACPWVTTSVEYFQLALIWFVYFYIQQLYVECWPGWSAKHITRERVWRYLGQYVPGALSLGSDFWRVAVIGIVASSLGDEKLAVWNASYRICWITLTFLGSLGGAMSIQLGQALGKGNAEESALLANIGLGISVLMGGGLALLVAMLPRQCGAIFSDDDTILDLFEEARWPMAAFVLTMNVGTMMEGIPRAAGRMRTAFYAGIIGSWVGQVPCVLLCTTFWRKDLLGLYTGVALGYALLIVMLGCAIWGIDWADVIREARERSEVATAAAVAASMQPLTGDSDAKEKEKQAASVASADARPSVADETGSTTTANKE